MYFENSEYIFSQFISSYYFYDVYEGNAAQEYELTLPYKKNIAKKALTKGKLMLYLQFSNFTAVQFCVLSI